MNLLWFDLYLVIKAECQFEDVEDALRKSIKNVQINASDFFQNVIYSSFIRRKRTPRTHQHTGQHTTAVISSVNTSVPTLSKTIKLYAQQQTNIID